MAGVDLTRVAQVQQDLELQAAARSMGDIPYYSPVVGSNNRIRLMPPWSAQGMFERESFMHFAVGDEAQIFTCPTKTPGIKNFPCPVCSHVEALRASGNPADAELAARMSARRRYASNVVDLNNPVYTQQDLTEWKAAMAGKTVDCPFKVGQTKIQVYTYGPMVYQHLINIFAQFRQDLTDLQTGYDIHITKTGKDLNVRYNVVPDPVRKPFPHVGELTIPNLDAMIRVPKLEQMVAAVSGGVAQVPASYGASQALPPPAMPASPPPALAPMSMPLPMPPQVQTLGSPPASAAAPAVEETPPCFKDTETFDQADPECAGGIVDGVAMPKCPVFQECGTHAGKLVAEPTSRRRRGKAADKKPDAMSEADILEQQMQDALRRS